MQPMGPLLLIDDDEVFTRVLSRALTSRGFTVAVAHDAAGALALTRREHPRYAVLDLKLGADNGLSLIPQLLAVAPQLRILLLTGYASIATAVEANKRGADNYLPKPVTAEALLRALNDEPAVEDIDTMTPLSRLEWEHIQQALLTCDGNISAAARLLGMHRRSLQRKLAKRPGPERIDREL